MADQHRHDERHDDRQTERHDERNDPRRETHGDTRTDDRKRDASSSSDEDPHDLARWRATRGKPADSTSSASNVLTQREREERWPIG